MYPQNKSYSTIGYLYYRIYRSRPYPTPLSPFAYAAVFQARLKLSFLLPVYREDCDSKHKNQYKYIFANRLFEQSPIKMQVHKSADAVVYR